MGLGAYMGGYVGSEGGNHSFVMQVLPGETEEGGTCYYIGFHDGSDSGSSIIRKTTAGRFPNIVGTYESGSTYYDENGQEQFNVHFVVATVS